MSARREWMTLMEAAIALRLDYQRVRLLIIRKHLDGRQVAGRYTPWKVTRASVARYRRKLEAVR